MSGGQPQYHFSVIVTFDSDTGMFVADIPTLTFQVHGESPEYVFLMAQEGIAMRLELMLEKGSTIPVEEHPAQVFQVIAMQTEWSAGLRPYVVVNPFDPQDFAPLEEL